MPSSTLTPGPSHFTPKVRDLRRVFDHLACHVERSNLSKTLAARQDRYSKLQHFVENPSAASPVQNADGQDISKYQVRHTPTSPGGGNNHSKQPPPPPTDIVRTFISPTPSHPRPQTS